MSDMPEIYYAYLWPNPEVTDPIYDANGDVYPPGGAYVPINDFYDRLTRERVLLTYLEDGSQGGPIIPGAGYAPANVQFVVLAPNGQTPNARTLAQGPGVSITDGGPGGSVTISAPGVAALLARLLVAGAGLTGGGDLSADRTFNVGAHADGSIAVNADNIQVGVLATDAQHGVRGGGTQHAVATVSDDGFMSKTDKAKLDGVANGATVGAPVGAQYVCLAADATLTSERVLTQGTGITITDNGPGQPVTVAQSTQSLGNKAMALSGWTFNPTNICWRFEDAFLVQNQISTGPGLPDNVWFIDLQSQLPQTCNSLTRVELFLIGTAGHSALPSTMPKMELRRYAPTGTFISYFTQTDAAATTAAYQAAHSIVWTGSMSMDMTRRHVLVVTGENGGTAVAGLKLTGLIVTCTFT